ncbi:MAG: T9SS type A sorting domain-containing protein [Bacteroidia bacterium]
MKKLLLFTSMFALAKLFGQAVPNGSFENWTTINYSEPTGFNTGNSRDVPRMGVASITKVTGFSGFAVRIQNNVVGSDTSDSYIINTNNPCSDVPQWTGGVPYSQQPTAITGKYRYNLLGTDTAILLVIFRKNGAHIGDNFIKIRGTGSQNTFASFSFTLACAGVPDSVIIAAASSNKKDASISYNGSFIELDNLAFTGATQVIPNGDFESWTNKSFDVANGWEETEIGVTKSTSSYSGTLALRLETMNRMCGGIDPGVVTTGHLSQNNGPKGGRPYTNTVDTLCGYYKYTSMGGDIAGIFVNLSKNGINVGGNSKQLNASASYIYFEIPISAGQTPDSMRIDIQSSSWPIQPGYLGSVLYIDNLYLKSLPLGIFENNLGNMNVYSFPNPAGNVLNIACGENLHAQSIIIYNSVGKIMASQDVTGSNNLVKINVEVLSQGIYFYEIKNHEGMFIRNKFIKE